MKRKKLPNYCMAQGCNPWQKNESGCCDNCFLKQSDGIVEQENNENEELELF